jgi:hypothetical protein
VLVPEGRRTHRSAPARPLRPVGIVLAACIGVACGIYDLHTGRSDSMALFLGAGGFLLAVVAPAGAVPRALVMGLSIPLVYFVATRLDLTIPFPPAPHYIVTVVALIPALAGTLLGLGLRRLLPTGGPARRARL